MSGADETPTTSRGRKRGSRFWLFAPFVLLGLVVAGWSVAWFAIRERVAQELDTVLGVQAALGRTWSCADRTIEGFPFRVEITCSSLALRVPSEGVVVELGRTQALAQVYQPRHVIVNAQGPLRVETPDGSVSAEWQLLEASIRNLGRGTEQLALVITEIDGTVSAAALPGAVPVGASRVQVYARPSPDVETAQDAIDVVVRADAVTSPLVDAALESASPADVEAQIRARGVRAAFRRRDDPAAAARAWRDAGGRVEVEVVSVTTPSAAVSVSGSLGLDTADRPEGTIDVSGWGLGPIARRALGERGGFMADAIVAALGGPNPPPAGSEPDLRPLPQVTIRDGRVFVGPVPVPVEVQPLFR